MTVKNENDLNELLAGGEGGEGAEEIQLDEDGNPIAGAGEEEVPPYLRDLTEDDVYDRLTRVNDFPSQLNGLESRFNGGVNDLTQRVANIEKATPTQTSFDVDKLTKGLEAYDPKLAEVLVPLLQDAFKVSAMDENTLRPYFDDANGKMKDWAGEQLVMSAYSPETLAEIIPPVQDGKFTPEGQRHKDFISWYSQQGYQVQQSLLSFGAPYINALRSFERWEQKKNKGRATTSQGKTDRLVNGQMPTSQHRKTPQPKQASLDEALADGFNEAFKEVSR